MGLITPVKRGLSFQFSTTDGSTYKDFKDADGFPIIRFYSNGDIKTRGNVGKFGGSWLTC